MRDDYLDRSWADHHHRFTGSFHKLVRDFAESMEHLTTQQFAAPWRKPARRDDCPTC
jgi:hypothetical protein